MRRVVSLCLPTWPTDRLRRRLGSAAPPPDAPLVIVGRDGRKRIVTAADPAAQALGLRPGLAATQAHALVPGLIVHDAAPAADAVALDDLGLWALKRYAPIVMADPPDGLLIDASGSAHLFGGEEALLADLIGRLGAAGVRGRAAMAPTYGAAHALARYGGRTTLVIAEGDAGRAIAGLPLGALRLTGELVAGLKQMGFDRIGEVEAQPRAPLALRFGPELGRRLDQAHGRVSEPVIAIEPPELIRVERRFAEPIGAAETIARYVEKLTVALCTVLESRGLGARRLDLLCHRVDNRVEAVRIGTAKPVRDIKRLTRLLTDKIETIAPGFGIELMALSAPVAEPLAYRAVASSLTDGAEPDVSGLIDTLANRVGAQRLYRLAAVQSDVPERSVRKVAPLAAATEMRWPPDWPRPTRLLKPPEPIDTIALLPDHPPSHFTWRGVRRRIKRADGPERIYGEWGRRDAEMAAVRDYFQAECDDGARFWLFRAGDGLDLGDRLAALVPARPVRVRYAELQCASHFSFLRGASSCEELFSQAAVAEIEALAITDRNSLAGIVRGHEAAKVTGVRLIVGCRLDLTDGAAVLVFPTDRSAYARLCRLLSLGKRRGGKAKCILGWEDLALYAEGLIGMLVPDKADAACTGQLRRVGDIFGDRAYCALTLRRRPRDQLRLHRLSNLAAQARVRPVVTNDALFHHPDRRVLQDVVTCIREGCTIDDVGFKRERSGDRHLKPAAEMHRLFARYPEALARTLEIADRCRFSLDELAYQYPEEATIPGLTPQEALERLTWEGAAARYPEGVPDKVKRSLRHELTLIQELGYAPYFLTVNSIVQFARSREILCQGRGSAANSAVCYVLGITSIDPERNDLLFERFVSQERKEPPDIDVDFEHERREIVMQWVYDTYGRDHAALCSTVIRYRAKGALRDVGKALGLTEDLIKMLSSQVWAWSTEGVEPKHAEELNLNLGDRRLRLALDLARQLIGAPRHLSQHPGGFVLTNDRLDELVPIEPAAMKDRQVIEWDKDDIDALKFMKVDVLALGMLSCMKRGFDLLAEHKGITLDLATIPPEDPRTYAMIRKADTLGVFQIESRAQMAMLPRIKPRTFYDLVIEVAIVRPGPIQGDMVHPYLRRREGKEPVDYPKPELEKVLGKTLGVPLFQEQAMRVAIECAGFTAGEADQLRRAMATFKFTGGVSHFRDKLVGGMVERGYTEEFATRTFTQLEGFGSYGFPESHAASFALIAYASSWLKCWHPDVFCAALLNAQPMGFYAPAQIVRDARDHGVEVRPVCVNASRWDCTLEPVGEDRFAVRLGMRMVRGLANADAAMVLAGRADLAFASVDDLWRRSEAPVASLVELAKADAFGPALGIARREALWAIKALRDEPLPLFAAASAREQAIVPEVSEEPIVLKPMTAGHQVVEDYGHVGLTLREHPVSFLRRDLAAQKVLRCSDAGATRDGRAVKVAGLVLVRQKPGSAKGVMFITIEDETGVANLVIWPSLYEKQRRVILTASMLRVDGRIQREGEVVHVVAHRLHDLSEALASVGDRDGSFPLPHGRGDEFHHGSPGHDPRDQPPRGVKPRDIYIPDLSLEAIRVRTRDFR